MKFGQLVIAFYRGWADDICNDDEILVHARQEI